MYEIVIKDSFAAAHYLNNYKGKCENLHGHNYAIEVFILAENLDKSGLGIDFSIAKRWLKEVLDKLDHKNLNDLVYFKEQSPSAENIARFIFEQYKQILPADLILKKTTVFETEKNGVSYYKELTV